MFALQKAFHACNLITIHEDFFLASTELTFPDVETCAIFMVTFFVGFWKSCQVIPSLENLVDYLGMEGMGSVLVDSSRRQKSSCILDIPRHLLFRVQVPLNKYRECSCTLGDWLYHNESCSYHLLSWSSCCEISESF